tara:strand:- start:830 stop:1360 length:531 start_codon:yes stop_codon:yes gene_type:complete
MKVAIVNDELLEVVNVVKANSIDDVKDGIVAESWMSPKVKYTIENGVRTPIPPVAPTFDELIVVADQMTNANTSKLINEGFLYSGIVFPLDIEGQINFSELQRLAVAGHIDYPYEVWNGQESTELADASEVEVFYLSGIAHKEGIMNAGRATRISNRNLSLAALQSYVDTASNSGE